MEVMVKKFYVSLFITVFFISASAQAKPYEETAQHVQNTLMCTKEQAFHFMSYIKRFMEEVENNFSTIASEKKSDTEKRQLISTTIYKHFQKPTSTVQVSSLTRDYIKSYPVREYLEHLLNLSKTHYTQVKLYFKPDYLSMGTIHPYYDPVYGKCFEFIIAIWQIFIGDTTDNRPPYYDATQKNFILMFHKDKNSEYWTLKIKSIFAKETITLVKYRRTVR